MLPRAFAPVVFRLATLVGMAAATALAVEYRSAESAFCGAGSGCAAVRRTGVAYLWGSGLTLPEVGLLGFALIFALSLTPKAVWAVRLALVAAAAGVALLAYQLDLATFCWLCVTSDVASAVAAVAGVVLLRGPGRDVASEFARAGPSSFRWSALGVLAVLGPALWPSVRPVSPVHAAVRAHYVDGKINVVEFADFECPYCRRLHPSLKALLAPYGDRVHLVRLNVPLESHPNARPAARAAICAEPSGKGEAYADFLFETEDFGEARLVAEATRLGIDRALFARCLGAPETERRIEREIAVLRDAGMEGLPTTYIGSRRIVGAASDEVLKDAIESAAQGGIDRGIPWWVYLVLLASVAAAIVVRVGGAAPGVEGPARR